MCAKDTSSPSRGAARHTYKKVSDTVNCERRNKSHSISYDFCASRIRGLEHNRSNDILWDYLTFTQNFHSVRHLWDYKLKHPPPINSRSSELHWITSLGIARK